MSFLFSVTALTATYGIASWLERRPQRRFRPLPSPRPYLATDVTWYALAIAASAVSVFLLRPWLARAAVAPVRDALAGLPTVAKFALSLVVFDFVLFAVHAGLHRSNVLWNFHKVHHSSQHLDALATARTHTFENVVRVLPGQVVLFMIGMPASVVAPSVAFGAAYAVSNHSNLRTDLRWLEGVLVTPRIHRRHHVPSTTQRNYGTIFSVWDRCFGTLVRADVAQDESYGVPGEIGRFPERFTNAFREPLRQLRRVPPAHEAQTACRTDEIGAAV